MSDVGLPASVEALRRVRQDPHRLGHRAHVPGRAPRRHRAGNDRSRQQAHHRWLRLLDLPAQRHRHVLLLLCRLRGAGRSHGRRPDAWREIVDTRTASAVETAALLLSSYTCMLGFAATNARSLLWTQVFMLITGLLGLVFVLLELQEFAELAERGIHAAAKRDAHVLLRSGGSARPARHDRRACGSPP